MSNITKADICIIGAGSAGLSVAAGAAQLGLNTILIEKSEMGGDCLNTGCVPSKALLKASKVANAFRTSDKYGIKSQEPQVDFHGVHEHVHGVIATIAPHDSQERFEGLGVDVIRAAGEFIDSKTVRAGDRLIRARNFIIATGSRAFLPPIEGLDPEKALTNETIFDLKEAPKHLIIIGGGPIGIEMAQAHLNLGCRVTVIEAGKILAHDDDDLVKPLKKRLEKQGVEILEKASVVSVKHTPKQVTVTCKKSGKSHDIKGSHLLVAAGRKPNIDNLGLDNAGVKFDNKGIGTDARLRTNKKHIYAAGDIAGGPQFTHVAGYHAGILIKNIIFKIPAKVDYSALPWVTYTDPELAAVGLSYKQAEEKFGLDNIDVVHWEYAENDRATAERETEGLIKIIIKKNGQILGATMLGPHAGESISMWILAVSKGLKLSDITNLIIPYPTFSEVGKRAAGSWYTPKLFSDKTRKIVSILKKLPF